ncbi:hypothetical protein, partial [Stieleria bergensis]|uniref:hypothetical protein n=1 Tax=Stieleria bergensis TaxID=2528025 RepID=UPI003AF37AB9
HSSWLDFLRRTLSFPISIRFYPGTPLTSLRLDSPASGRVQSTNFPISNNLLLNPAMADKEILFPEYSASMDRLQTGLFLCFATLK